MGRPKLLLPWGEKTILRHLIDQWRTVGSSQIAAVIGPRSPLADHLEGVERIVNPQPEAGMFSSVQCATAWEGWSNDLTHFVVTLGDQPQVGIGTLREIIHFAGKHPDHICQPARRGRGRHPLVVPRGIFLEVGKSTARDLKEFLAARERKMFESDDPGLDVDLDTPEDYRGMVKSVTGVK